MKAPRLIGVLIDLPAPALSALATAWRCEATPRAVYEAMTDAHRLAVAIETLSEAARQLVRAVASEPLPLDDLLARVAIGRVTAERALLELGALALVVRVGPSGRAQPLFGSAGRDRLAVPREVAASLRSVAAR